MAEKSPTAGIVSAIGRQDPSSAPHLSGAASIFAGHTFDKRFHFMQKSTLVLLLSLFATALLAQPKIQLVPFASGFDRPIGIEHCGDSRLFIVEQDGLIWIVDSLGNKLPEPFLDIDARVQSTGNEQGLLGLAFHPKYAENGYFYVHYSKNNGGDTRIARFSVTADPNKADPNSELMILEADQPYSNHNGGKIAFSPVDSFLYIGLGDGGSGGDPQNNGQKKNTFLGKILRIDVNGPTGPYAVPPSNPFVGNSDFLPEIWSYGLRNPWRFSFDRLTGDMWIGDVGQNAREEVDFEPAGLGGRNYGWRCYEGTQTYNTSGCLGAANYTPPVFEYNNPSIGCSITGGHIYRGTQYQDLYGVYLVTDYCSGRWWATSRTANGGFSTDQIANLTDYEYTSLGEDKKGELYVSLLSTGQIMRIKELCSPFQLSGNATAAVCPGSQQGTITLTATGATGNVSYNWSTGANTQNVSGLNPGSYIVVATDGNGCVRRDTFDIGSEGPAAPVISVASGSLSLCPGGSAVLEASAAPQGYTYQWWYQNAPIDGATAQQLTVSAPGSYSVQLVSGDCTVSALLAVQVSEIAFNNLAIQIAQGDNYLCPGESLELQLTGAPVDYTIQWFTSGGALSGANAAALNVTEGGFYFAEITGACGSFNTDIQTVEQEVGSNPLISQIGNQLILSENFAAYQWSLNGNPIAGGNGVSLEITESGLYSCVVTSDGGCPYTASAQIVGVSLPAGVKQFSLAPNPTSGVAVMQLELERTSPVKIFLTDTSGRQIFLQTQQNRQIKLDIDLRALAKGVYLLHVETATGSFVRRVVKD
jgi:glucose/arabinose dehydrogenase